MHTLRHSREALTPRMGGFEEMQDEVAQNWMSVTSDDCARLARMRPGDGNIPLICQIQAVQDLKSMRVTDVASAYRTTQQSLYRWRHSGFTFQGPLPSGFDTLVNSFAL